MALPKTIGKTICLISLIVLAAAYCTGSVNPGMSDLLFFLFFFGISAGTVCLALAREGLDGCLAAQLAAVYGILILFWSTNYVKSKEYGEAINNRLAAAGLIALTSCFMICFLTLLLNLRKRHTIRRIRSIILDNRMIIFLCIVFILLYIPTFQYLFKGDSYIYYSSAVSNMGRWPFSLSDISELRMADHLTFGYSLLLYPMGILFGKNGFRIVNLLLIVTASLALYDIGLRIFHSKSRMTAALAALLFLAQPSICGISQELSIDLPLACIMVWVIWSYVSGYRVFLLASVLLLSFSKENSVIFLCGFFAGIVIYRIITGAGIRHLIKRDEWILLIGPALLFISIIVLKYSWQAARLGASSQTSAGQVNSVHVDWQYIWFKLKELYVLNFQWLFTAVFVLFAARRAVRKDNCINGDIRAALAVSYFLMTMFQLVYVTYPNYRYLMYAAPYNALFLGIVCDHRAEGKQRRIEAGVLISLAALLGVQSFCQIDMVSNKVFQQTSAGNGKLISLAEFGGTKDDVTAFAKNKNGGLYREERLRDYIQINREYLGLQDCFEKALEIIKPDRNTGVVLEEGFHNQSFGGKVWTAMNLFGLFDIDELRWIDSKSQIDYGMIGKGIKINWLAMHDDLSSYENLWYIETPFAEEEGSESFLAENRIIKNYTVKEGKWCLKLYHLDTQKTS